MHARACIHCVYRQPYIHAHVHTNALPEKYKTKANKIEKNHLRKLKHTFIASTHMRRAQKYICILNMKIPHPSLPYTHAQQNLYSTVESGYMADVCPATSAAK